MVSIGGLHRRRGNFHWDSVPVVMAADISVCSNSEVGLWAKSSLQTGMVVVNQEFLLIIRGSGTEMKLVKPKQFAF